MSTSRDDRPTFGTYWKKNKENSTVKGLVFVQSDPGQSSSKGSEKTTEESEQSAKDKRRAQVRKAQIQHRARKANYTKQLEADIAAIREQIEDAERDRYLLNTENQAIRAQLPGPQQAANHANPGYYTTPATYPQDTTMSYGYDIKSTSLDYVDVADAGLHDMFGAPGAYHHDGSPACASSSRESSGLQHSSSQYMDSGDNIPYQLTPALNSQDQSHHAMNYMSGYP